MNASIPVTSNHPQSYAIVQSSQPSTLATTTSQLPAGSGGDIHICGACGSRFTEIKEFVTHKRQGCQGGTGVGSCTTVSQHQVPSASSVQQQTQPSPGSMMGVPVGMPHVVLQTASGPPQVYRIVLEPSIPTSTQQSTPSIQGPAPILAQALSGETVPHLSPAPSHHLMPHPPLPHHTHSTPQDGGIAQVVEGSSTSSGTSGGSLLHLTQVEETWHTSGAATLTPSGSVEGEGGVMGSGAAERRGIVDGSPTSEDNSTQGSNRPPSVAVDRGIVRLEGDLASSATSTNTTTTTTTTTTMHTEEEDVATFLATQLASQAVPPHTTTVSEQLMSGVVNNIPTSDGQLQFTSAPTQPQQLHLTIQEQAVQSDSFGGEIRSSGSGRRGIKGVPNHEESSTIDSKANILTTYPKETLVVHDGIHKEKACPIKDCNFVTYHNKDLSRHIRKHTGEKPYRCEECGTCFSRGDKLKVHSRIHTNQRPYWCNEEGCQYRAIDSGSLRKHMRTHTNERPYRCQLCPYSARDGSQLTVHLRTHTGDTPFQCMVENCSAAFKTSSDLRRHERLHTGIKPYKCSACDYACAIKSNLTVHMRLNHYKGAKFSCTKCEFLGNSRKQLKDHEKSHANVLLQCERCDHVSTSNTGLRQHMLIHSQEKPFQCRYCAFTCKTTGNLRYHVRNKHGCDVSGRKRGNIGRGRAAAVGGGGIGGRRAGRPACFRSFKCSDCGSGFVREDSYRSHMRQHEKHRMAQAISGKMEPDVFSVVVQDEGLMGVEQPEEGEDAGEAHDGVTTFHRIPTESLQPGTLISQSAVAGGSSGQGSDGSINGYSSYVITIDGISTVFSNPVRLAANTEASESLSGAVQVITGDILSSSGSSEPKVNYDPGEDTKLPGGPQACPQDKGSREGHHLYDLAPGNKVTTGQATFTHEAGQGEANREYSPSALPQTVLLEQHSAMGDTLDTSLQGHNLPAKPKVE